MDLLAIENFHFFANNSEVSAMADDASFPIKLRRLVECCDDLLLYLPSFNEGFETMYEGLFSKLGVGLITKELLTNDGIPAIKLQKMPPLIH